MCYSTVRDRKSGTVMLGTGNVYSTDGDRKYVSVLLGTGYVVQY
jgi:hypothetical protein